MNATHRVPPLFARGVRAGLAAAALICLAGQAWAEPCSPADLNGDGMIDFSDYLEFLNRYDIGDLSVDYTGDGM
ncbi:MAG: hypothetical protein IT436_18110, partial [Phycisphaerales bacterium]|nr:hypothetical protein [Phycisphaerales bacterium]